METPKWEAFQELERSALMANGFIALMLRAQFVWRVEPGSGMSEAENGGIYELAEAVVSRQEKAVERVRLALGEKSESGA